jgi:hypothetical protein
LHHKCDAYYYFDMNIKRSLLLAIALSLGVAIGLLLTLPPSREPGGGLFVTFVGLTNDASGIVSAQFDVANHFTRQARFGVCEMQVRETNGWPDAVRVAGGAAWLQVPPGGQRTISVRPPSQERASWRLPLMYQEDLSFMNNLRFRLDLLAWGIARWRPGQPIPVRHGDGFHRTFIAYGPEMKGVDLNGATNKSELFRSLSSRAP